MNWRTIVFGIAMASAAPPTRAALDPTMEFKSILQTILDQASSIESQKAMLDASVATQTSKSLYWTPTGSIAVTNEMTKAILADTPGNGTLVTANLNVFKFGSSELARRAADEKVTAEKSRLGQAREDLESSAANLIFQLIRQRQMIDIQNGHVRVQLQSLRVAKERYRQGQLAEQEYDKAEVDYDASQIALAEAELNELQTLNSIKTLAEVDPQIRDWPLASAAKEESALRRKAADFYAVRAAFLDADYFHKSAQQVWRSSYLPSLDITAGWQDFGYAPPDQGQWYAGLTFTVPLWDQLQGSAQAQNFESSARAAAATHRQSLRQAQASLDTLDRRLELARTNLQLAKQSATKLEQLRNDSLKRFRLGRLSVNDLFIDENRYLDSENSLLTSTFSYLQLQVEACHSRNESIINCF